MNKDKNGVPVYEDDFFWFDVDVFPQDVKSEVKESVVSTVTGNTQTARLLDYLHRYRTITPMEAWEKLGIYRLGARIHDLKKAGYDIESGRVMITNRYGEPCIVAKYKLMEAFH